MALTPIKSIRAKCLDCCCGQITEVRLCPSKNCPLYPYRMGHRPPRVKLTTENEETEKNEDSTTISEQEAQEDAE